MAVFGMGEPGSRPGRHFFMTRRGRTSTWKKKKIICAAKQFSIIYDITVVPLLAEKVLCTEAARAVQRTVSLSSPKWSRQGGGAPLSRLN